MVHQMVALNQKPVALSNNKFSTLQFAQDLARQSSGDHGRTDSFFVADLGKIDSLVREWSEHLPRVRPFYAVKCNSDELFLRVLASHPEIGFCCASRQHLDLALDFAGPERLFYSNPCWTRNALLGAQNNNVALMGFDSEADLSRFAKAGVTNKLILNICMPSNEESPIGCDVSKATELLQLAADFGLDCVGIGFNVCGQRLGLFDSMIECAAQLFAIGRSMGLEMKVLNLGGGFPSVLSSKFLSFEQICERLNASLDYYFPNCDDIEIMATPGRFFASPVFSLATRIIDALEVDASQITNDDFDAGQRAFVYKISEGYYGAFGCSVMPNCEPKCHPLFEDSIDDNQSQLFYGAIQGPQNDDEFDVVQKQCRFRQMNVNDWLVWPSMGSYSMGNCESLDDEPCSSPEIYYFSNKNNWKFVNDSALDGQSDGESSANSGEEDDGVEDPFWMFDLPIV